MFSKLFLDRTRRLRTVWRFLIFGVGFVIVELVVGILTGIALAVYLLATGDSLELFHPDNIDALLSDWVVPITLISALPNTALLLGLVVFCRKLLDRRSVASMGMGRPKRGYRASMWVGFAAGAAPIAAAVLVLWACGGYRLVGFSCSPLTLLMAAALILMAFQEEIIFRGYVYQNFLDIRRPVFGVLLSSIFFSLLHSLNPHVWESPIPVINLFGAGVVLALAYRVSGDIWFPTAMHFGWNAAQGVLFSVPISGMSLEGFVRLECNDAMPQWLTGGPFGLEGSLLATAVEVGLVIAFLLLLSRRRRKEAKLPMAVLVEVGARRGW